MPIHQNGSGWQWGNHGKVYPTREVLRNKLQRRTPPVGMATP